MCRVSRIAFGALIFTIKSVSMRGGRNLSLRAFRSTKDKLMK